MSSMKLYRETTCEHGLTGQHETWQSDDGEVLFNIDSYRGEMDFDFVGECPGGSREEVVIDYEAASKRRYEDVKQLAEQNGLVGLIDWDDLEDDERQQIVAASHPYVDAALKSAGFTTTFASEKSSKE